MSSETAVTCPGQDEFQGPLKPQASRTGVRTLSRQPRNKWEAEGSCEYGINGRFAHGASELRVLNSNEGHVWELVPNLAAQSIFKNGEEGHQSFNTKTSTLHSRLTAKFGSVIVTLPILLKMRALELSKRTLQEINPQL